jgi:phosphate transport system substrate-binding protein
MRTKSLGVIAALVVGLAAVMAALAATSAPAKTTRASADELVGAGSSFVAPLVSQWQKDYEGKTGVKNTNRPIGSGGGI